MDLIKALSATFDHAHGVIAANGVGHSIRGETPLADHAVVGKDPAAQFRAAADSTLAAWKSAGLDGETNIGAGPMPSQAAISVNRSAAMRLRK